MTEVIYRPCKQAHLGLIRPQPHDRALLSNYMHPDFKEILDTSFGISAWVDGKPVAAAGIIHMHSHCALGWAMLGAEAGPYLRNITKAVRKALDESYYPRIEMRVICDFEEGHRWAKLLGFTVEAPLMRSSGARGEDETLYARIKE